MQFEDLLTPALLLDLDILERNLSRMQHKISALGPDLRPHIKTHKCVEIAKRQSQLGARGITVSTFYEAQEFAKAGFNDITWAFPIPLVYASRAVDLAKSVTLRVVVDSKEAIHHLEQSCKIAGGKIHVWLKVDCGYHRAGVDPASPEAEELIRSLSESQYFLFDGILSHSGHAYSGTSRSQILAAANQERDVMVEFAVRMRIRGYEVSGVSIGSTPSMSVIENLDGVTEVRPGNYCFYDNTMVSLGVCGVQDCAVTLLASVISHQPRSLHFVVDAGALALSKDTGASHLHPEAGMGALFEGDEKRRLYPGVRLKTLSQEHGKAAADESSLIEGKFRVGDRIRILENHSCLTVAHFDEYNIVRGNEIVDRWKILRGRI
jgi:D-serine deaminase-like pyridoxal phosphate-dependent protein